jgi:hypothetical protein
LVAHGLGIDHAGHMHDVDSPQMLAKLRETDAHIKQASIPVEICPVYSRLRECDSLPLYLYVRYRP